MGRRPQAAPRPARETDIALPLRGLMSRALNARAPQDTAAEVRNWRSNGLSMEMRDGVAWAGGISSVLRRIPHAVATSPQLIDMRGSRLSTTTATVYRQNSIAATVATLSGNTIIADATDRIVRFDGVDFHFGGFTTTTGDDPDRFDGVVAHNERLYFWKEGSADFWYAEIGAILGPLARFPMSRLGQIKGSIATMISLTVDAGNDMNDMLAIITTEGQYVVYQGLDPADPQDWAIVGRVQASAPVGRHALVQIGADVWMVAKSGGVVSLGESLRSSTLALVSDVGRPILARVQEWIAAGGAWQAFSSPEGRAIIINQVLTDSARQLMFDLESRCWTTADMPVRWFHVDQQKPAVVALDGKMGTFGKAAGAAFTARWVSGWISAGTDTRVAWVEPTIACDGPVTVRIAVLSDDDDGAESADMQSITEAPRVPGAMVSPRFAIGQSGERFRVILEVDAPWAELVKLKAAIG